MRRIAVYAAALILGVVFAAEAADLTKRKIGKQDHQFWDGGATDTFTGETSTGRTITLDDIDWPGVDVEGWYGSQVWAGVTAAITAVGGTRKAAIWLAPGTWTMDANTTFSSNITLVCAPGALITLGTYNLTINGPLTAGPYQIFSENSTGVVTFGDNVPEMYVEWWGTDAAAFQNAVTCAVTSGVRIQLLPDAYSFDTGVTAAGPFDLWGAGANDTVITYTGSATFIEFTAAASRMHWQDFKVSSTGNPNNNVDLIDMDDGGSYNLFENINFDVTAAIRHGWILRGTNAAGTANNNQYDNAWINCRVSGNDGTCFYLYSTDIVNSRCNNNTFTNCVTGTACDLAYAVNGSSNTWFGGDVNNGSGSYSMEFTGSATQRNAMFGTYFDGTPDPIVFKIDDSDITEAPCSFFMCHNIMYNYSNPFAATSAIHDYDADGVTQNSPGRIAIFDGARLMLLRPFGNPFYTFELPSGNDYRFYGGDVTLDDGNLTFGASQDVNLYRGGANQLKTDDTLKIGKFFGCDSATELTIASGSITPTQGYHRVDTEGEVAGPDYVCSILDGTTTGTASAGDLLFLKAQNSGRTVVFGDWGSGTCGALGETENLYLDGDCTLDNAADFLLLINTDGEWSEINCSDNGS